MNKYFVILTTAMPGLQKLIMFVVCERVLSIGELGDFSSDYSILFVLSYINAIGWAGLILTRAPKLDTRTGEKYLFDILVTAINYYLISVGLIVALYLLGMISSLLEAIVFSFVWMLYQIIRHYRLSKSQYKKILFSDIILLFVFLCLITLSFPPLISIACSCMIAFFLLFTNKMEREIKFVPWVDQVKSLQISVNNFLYSAILMGLPFIVSINGEIKMAAMLGYFISLFSVSLLFSRGVSIYYIPLLASTDSSELKELFFKFLLFNTMAIFAVFGGGALLYLVIEPYLGMLSFDVSSNLSLLVSLMLAVSIGALSTPASSILLAKEYTTKLLKSSLAQFVVCSFGVGSYLCDLISMGSLLNIIIGGSLLKIIITYIYASELLRDKNLINEAG
jgi:hypothetical protein